MSARSILVAVRPPDADLVIPGSKSLTNRALVCAALAPGTSRLTGVGLSDDTEAMLDCLARLGARSSIDRDTVTVEGIAGRLPEEPVALQARQSGTTARFLMAVAAAGHAPVELDGAPQLRGRPMGDGFDALRSLGAAVEELGPVARLPVRITGPAGHAPRIEVAGAVSSQFLSGLVLAGPALSGQLTIEVVGHLVSRTYVEMTLAVVRDFGATAAFDGELLTVGPAYRSTSYAVEPDASSASYFLAAAAVTGGRVRIEGLGRRSRQGDVAFAEVLAAMGAEVTWWDEAVQVQGTGVLHGGTFDLGEISDTAPTLAAIAPFADSPVEVTGIGFIRHKESDRVAAPVAELRRLGLSASETPDGFVVEPGTPRPVEPVRTYDDHRMAMAFAVIGLVVPGLEIADPGCVAKTFPSYFTVLDSLARSG